MVLPCPSQESFNYADNHTYSICCSSHFQMSREHNYCRVALGILLPALGLGTSLQVLSWNTEHYPHCPIPAHLVIPKPQVDVCYREFKISNTEE